MTSRERVLLALQHREADRVPLDLGAMVSTGIMGIAYNKLKAYLGIRRGHTRIYDWGQQLAQVEPQVLEAVNADVLPLMVDEPTKWKTATLPDGSPCEVPDSFNPEREPDGSYVIRDNSGRITARMPQDGLYFDNVYHPLADISSIQELEEVNFSSVPDDETLADLRQRAQRLYETTDYAIMLNGVGSIYEAAQGLRGWGNFMMDLVATPELAGALLDKLVDAAIERLERILPVVEGYVQVVEVGDDLGLQDGPQLSPSLYRDMVKPRHKRLYAAIKQRTSAYLFLHTCGSVYEFIPDFIEMGVDALNPVQVSAKDMDSKKLKAEFGSQITFWGGGCDTQHVLPFGTPEQIKEEVRRRVGDLAPGGGFVFTQVHNIQADVPPENIMAMVDAAQEFGRY